MTVRLVSFRRVSALLQGSQFESDRDAGVQVAQFEHMDAPWAVVINGVFLTLSSIGVPFFFTQQARAQAAVVGENRSFVVNVLSAKEIGFCTSEGRGQSGKEKGPPPTGTVI